MGPDLRACFTLRLSVRSTRPIDRALHHSGTAHRCYNCCAQRTPRAARSCSRAQLCPIRKKSSTCKQCWSRIAEGCAFFRSSSRCWGARRPHRIWSSGSKKPTIIFSTSPPPCARMVLTLPVVQTTNPNMIQQRCSLKQRTRIFEVICGKQSGCMNRCLRSLPFIRALRNG